MNNCEQIVELLDTLVIASRFIVGLLALILGIIIGREWDW